ncbi:MAG TPA: sigma-70 family RNA polymerase sigma factor [Planctomycetota bacterium]|nr:sigma-70 family RNA polymerase sigma factor [Planctomycetota bacterium]
MNHTTAALAIMNASASSSEDLPDGFWDLVDRYRSDLMNQALAILGTIEDAEDCVQDTFAEVCRQHAKIGAVRSLGAWLRKINRANAVDRLRLQRGSKVKSAEKTLVTTGGFTFMETRDFVARAIEKLPSELRQVVILHYWENLDYDAISKKLKVSSMTVRRRLYEGGKMLYRILAPNPSAEPAGAKKEQPE